MIPIAYHAAVAVVAKGEEKSMPHSGGRFLQSFHLFHARHVEMIFTTLGKTSRQKALDSNRNHPNIASYTVTFTTIVR